MWAFFEDAAWVVSIAIFAWLIWDFFRINMRYPEEVLLSSREGVDELFAQTGQTLEH
jgi:hypothetical protein